MAWARITPALRESRAGHVTTGSPDSLVPVRRAVPAQALVIVRLGNLAPADAGFFLAPLRQHRLVIGVRSHNPIIPAVPAAAVTDYLAGTANDIDGASLLPWRQRWSIDVVCGRPGGSLRREQRCTGVHAVTAAAGEARTCRGP